MHDVMQDADQLSAGIVRGMTSAVTYAVDNEDVCSNRIEACIRA